MNKTSEHDIETIKACIAMYKKNKTKRHAETMIKILEKMLEEKSQLKIEFPKRKTENEEANQLILKIAKKL